MSDKIKNRNHLIYRKGFWMTYTAFSYASSILGSLSLLISLVDVFDSISTRSNTSDALFHLTISIFFLIAGIMFLEARTFWGRLLLYTRKQDRQNELVINAKDVDDYRQKEAERERQQLQQMDKTIEAAVERKLGDMDEKMESYTKMNAKLQQSFQNQYMSYLESRLKKLDETFSRIGRLATSETRSEMAGHQENRHYDDIYFDAPPEDGKEEDESVSFEDAERNIRYAGGIDDSSIDDEINQNEDIYDDEQFAEDSVPDDFLSEA